METTFNDYAYPVLSTIYINGSGMAISKSLDSDIGVISSLEKAIFKHWLYD